MTTLLRRKPKEKTILYRNRGGFLAFLGQCAHPSKFEEDGIEYIDVNICNIGCQNKMTCKDYWNRKRRVEKSIELNYQIINPKQIKEELNDKKL